MIDHQFLNHLIQTRKGKNGAANFWRRDLGDCISCEPFDPVFEDRNIWNSCWVEPKNNRRVCAYGCIGGYQMQVKIKNRKISSNNFQKYFFTKFLIEPKALPISELNVNAKEYGIAKNILITVPRGKYFLAKSKKFPFRVRAP